MAKKQGEPAADAGDAKPQAAGAALTDVVLRQACGGLEAGAVLGQVRLRKGVSLNFLVDAVRSGIAREAVEE